jgi:hypothetical protein
MVNVDIDESEKGERKVYACIVKIPEAPGLTG